MRASQRVERVKRESWEKVLYAYTAACIGVEARAGSVRYGVNDLAVFELILCALAFLIRLEDSSGAAAQHKSM